MIAFVRKNLSGLILKHTSPLVCRSTSTSGSPVSFSFSLHFFSSSTETHHGICPAVFDILVRKYDVSPELASRVASELSHLKTPEKPDSILSFFKENGFSNTQLEKILKYKPRFLLASLEGCIKPKIKVLQDEGFSSDDITKTISNNPKILHSNLKNSIIPSLSVVKDLLGSTNEVVRIMRISQRFVTVNFQTTLLPNVEILKSFGIPLGTIRIIFTAYPNCFCVKPQAMRKYAEKAIKMGLDANSKSFVYCIATMSRMRDEAWELKFQSLRDLGFSDSDILTMFRKAPQTLSVSTKKLNKVVELLLGTRKYNLSSIVDCPRSLSFSIEKRYISRLRILGILESRNRIMEWPGLRTLCGSTDDEFSDRYITPYLDEVGDFRGRKSSASGKKG